MTEPTLHAADWLAASLRAAYLASRWCETFRLLRNG